MIAPLKSQKHVYIKKQILKRNFRVKYNVVTPNLMDITQNHLEKYAGKLRLPRPN